MRFLSLLFILISFQSIAQEKDSWERSVMKMNLVGIVFLSADLFYEITLKDYLGLQFGLQYTPKEQGATSVDEEFSMFAISVEPKYYLGSSERRRLYLSPYLRAKFRSGLEPYYSHKSSDVYLGLMIGTRRLNTKKWSLKDTDVGFGMALTEQPQISGFIDFRLRINFGVALDR